MILNTTKFVHDRTHDFASRRHINVEELLADSVPRNIVYDRRNVVHPTNGADVLVVIMVLTELLKARVQVTDVRRTPCNPLAVEFEHDPKRRVGRGVLRSKIEHPTIFRPKVVLQILGRFDVETKGFFRLKRVGHGTGSIGS